MSACAYCHRRKGKRGCPALGGAICSECCGRHRLKEIECPADCAWLGGLAVLRDPARASVDFTRDDFASALDKLLTYARPFREEAFSQFFGEGEPQEWEMAPGSAYLAYGHRGADGQRVVDRFLSARGRELRPSEAAAVVALQRAWASLFEVTSVKSGVGLELHDLLSGDVVEVREVSGTSRLGKWDVLLAWVIAFPDHVELTGAACMVPRAHLARVREALDGELVRRRRQRVGATDRELVGEIVWAPVRALREAIRDFRMPELRTMDGEEILLCRAHYTVKDEAIARERLEAVPELDVDGDDYVWLDPAGHPDLGEGALSLGRIRVGADELVLETMSRERLARGKLLLEAVLFDAAAHRADSIAAPEAALRKHEHREQAHGIRGRTDDVPEEVARQVVGQYLQDHYRRWVDSPLPALGGKTPRKAVRNRAGRTRVEALLTEIENGTLRMPGGEAVDFAAMRRELGIADDDNDDDGPITRYDAGESPDPERWLEADEQVKAHAVEDHHRRLGVDVPDPHLHALVHVIVENQLAAGEPQAARETMARLLAARVSRHDAIHAVGSVVSAAMSKVLHEGSAYDRDEVARALARLRPEDWIVGES
jgi:hypothetical protein